MMMECGDKIWRQKTRIIGLPYGEEIMIVGRTIWAQSTSVTDRRTGGRADGRTDRYTGWPNKNRTFLRYHIFAATTDIIMRFLLKCSEITAENNKGKFFETSVKYSLQSNQKWTTSFKTVGR